MKLRLLFVITLAIIAGLAIHWFISSEPEEKLPPWVKNPEAVASQYPGYTLVVGVGKSSRASTAYEKARMNAIAELARRKNTGSSSQGSGGSTVTHITGTQVLVKHVQQKGDLYVAYCLLGQEETGQAEPTGDIEGEE